MKTLTSFAADDPATICAIEDSRVLTWGELDDSSNRLASSLERLGIGRGDVVAIRLQTRLEWLVVSLGLAKLGATAVGVNYKLAPPETTFVLRDCNARAAIVDDADPSPLIEAWHPLNLAAVVTIDSPAAVGAHTLHDLIAGGDPEPRPARDLVPLVIYTSGTTGVPKGAPINSFRNQPDKRTMAEYGRSVGFDGASYGRGTVTLVNLPMHHGAGPNFTRSCIRSGGSVVFQRRFDAEDALRLIEQRGVTHWITVPTMLQRVVNLSPGVTARYNVSSMRFLLGGAAPFGPELKRKALELFGDVVYEIYGCTEAGMVAGARPADLRRNPGTSGKPFRHVDVKIVDEQGNDLPAGRTGEIVARTPSIISGYIGRGELGADRLLPGGFYRTGDVGHLDDDGYLFIYDRLTDMVIAGGVNIYPAEIEAVLNSHPAVALSAVIGEPHSELGEQPVAIVQLGPDMSTTGAELLEYCAGKLAKFKWPRRFDFVDEIPTNPVGKILKRELKKQTAR